MQYFYEATNSMFLNSMTKEAATGWNKLLRNQKATFMVGSLSSVLTEVTYGKICSGSGEKPRRSQRFSFSL